MAPGPAHGDFDDVRAYIGDTRDLTERYEAPGDVMHLLTESERSADPLAALSVAGSQVRARRPDGLTSREAEVLGLLATGHTNKDIAAELVLSVHTVERHLQNAYRKVGLRNRAEAAAYIVRSAA